VIKWLERDMHFPRSVGAGFIFAIAALEPAGAAEWRFCIAPSNQDHKIYMTAPFPAGTSMEALETSFHKALEQAGHHHDSVQCPTGAGEQAVRAMRQHAREFNLQLGNEVIAVDWRTPRH
jgi:hypothetical protein